MKAKVKTWLRNVENGNIERNHEKALNEIKRNTPFGITTHRLREVLPMSHQTLTARLSELADNGLIQCHSQKECEGTTYSNWIYVKDLELRGVLIQLRKKEKYLQWLKKADSYFEFMNDETVKMICYEQNKNNL